MDKLPVDATAINSLVLLARAAGDAIMDVYKSAEFGVEHKADESPVTRADIAAHDIIAAGLPRLLDLPIISEEAPVPSASERQAWGRYWLVDPLDGTKEFILRSGEFTVNIALIEEGIPVLGVVHLPAQQTTYLGVARQLSADYGGAWKYQQDYPATRIHVRSLAQARDDNALVVLASHRHGTGAVNQLVEQLRGRWPGAVQLSNAGSSLKFCRIAEGVADFYPRLAPTSEWDTAAAQAVLQAAGGAVVNAEESSAAWLKPLVYNGKDTIINPDFYALGDVNLDWSALLKRSETETGMKRT